MFVYAHNDQSFSSPYATREEALKQAALVHPCKTELTIGKARYIPLREEQGMDTLIEDFLSSIRYSTAHPQEAEFYNCLDKLSQALDEWVGVMKVRVIYDIETVPVTVSAPPESRPKTLLKSLRGFLLR